MNRATSASEAIFLTRALLGGGFAADLYASKKAKGDVGLRDVSKEARSTICKRHTECAISTASWRSGATRGTAKRVRGRHQH